MTDRRRPEEVLVAIRVAGADLTLDRARGMLRCFPWLVLDEPTRDALKAAKPGLRVILEALDPPADHCARCAARQRLVRGYWWEPIPGGYCGDCAGVVAAELDETHGWPACSWDDEDALA